MQCLCDAGLCLKLRLCDTFRISELSLHAFTSAAIREAAFRWPPLRLCCLCVCASGARAHIAMKSVIQVTCSALFLCTSGAQLAAADDAATSPMSLARSLQPASVYPALEETLKAAEAKLDVRLSCVARAYQLNRVLIRVSFLQAYYEKHLAELPKAVAKHTEADKVISLLLPSTICDCTRLPPMVCLFPELLCQAALQETMSQTTLAAQQVREPFA